ncbi:MAG: outer membrane lipid asymmetry maintenance protein MlaD [Gammaproteobacteria bacterium]|nr:outer membrane lipid asymmetry maintenance protein MlaD [Gammaproteobacteria bacterium]
MNSRTIEILVGFFMALGIAALVMLALKVSNLASFGTDKGYTVKASFEDIGGLKVRSKVAVGGVQVGEVESIDYDMETFKANVTLHIKGQYDGFPTDTAANIYTSGLLGEQYVGLEPGGSLDFLQDGDVIDFTQSAMVLERLIGQYIFSSGGKK